MKRDVTTNYVLPLHQLFNILKTAIFSINGTGGRTNYQEFELIPLLLFAGWASTIFPKGFPQKLMKRSKQYPQSIGGQLGNEAPLLHILDMV